MKDKEMSKNRVSINLKNYFDAIFKEEEEKEE
jgi:hypothetical protein